MKTALVTHEEMIEAIEQHTTCISTRDIPSIVANYFMITKQLYRRKDKNAVNRILLTDIREYLIEQGRLPYADVAAERRKEAEKMQQQITTEQPMPSTLPIASAESIDSQQLLKMVNEARKQYGEPPVRNNKFIEKVVNELDGEFYTKSVKPSGTSGGRPVEVIDMTIKQALRVAARESKAVRRSLFNKLEELQQQAQPLPMPCASFVAEKRKIAPTPAEVCGKKNTSDELPVLEWNGVRVVTTETLAKGYGTDTENIRRNLNRNRSRFVEGVHVFQLDTEGVEILRRTVSPAQISNKLRSITLWTEKGAARMSKIVDTDQAWTFFEKLEESYFRQKEPTVTQAIPQSLPEALRLAAELAEQKERLEQRQLLLEKELKQAAPKVEFADRVATANGILIGNFAKAIGLKQNFLFSWLRENKLLIASGSRRNVPMQQYIDQGYFSVREVVIDDEQNHRIALTTHITGKGQQWLTRRLLDSGLLKTIANTPN